MLRTLKISLALRNAHHANALIYALAHTPLIRRLRPAAPYGAHTQMCIRDRPHRNFKRRRHDSTAPATDRLRAVRQQ